MHAMIVGQSESGKTRLAKLLCAALHKQRFNTAVLDPMYDTEWESGYFTAKPEDFSNHLRAQRETFAFVDECGEVFNEGRDFTLSWLGTRSRHYGHNVHFISQRVIQIPTTMRYQSRRLYLFTTPYVDCEILAKEWNSQAVLSGHTLKQFEFLRVSRTRPAEKYHLDPKSGKIRQIPLNPA